MVCFWQLIGWKENITHLAFIFRFIAKVLVILSRRKMLISEVSVLEIFILEKFPY